MKRILTALVCFLFSAPISLAGVDAQEPLDALPHLEVVNSDESRVFEAAWSPDGTMLALTVDTTIWIYTPELKAMAQLDGHTDTVITVSWSPDGSQLASGSLDKTIRIWDMRPGIGFGVTERVLKQEDWILMVRWSPSGDRLASQVFERAVAPTNDGDGYYSTSIWDALTWEIETTLPSFAGFPTLSWNRDGTQIANAGFAPFDEGIAVRVWDADLGKRLHFLTFGGEKKISNVEYSPDGQFLAVSSEWPYVFIVDVTKEDYGTVLERLSSISAVTWKPDGLQVAAGDQLGNLAVWDVNTARPLVWIPDAHEGWITTVSWNPAGTKLASLGTEDKTLRIWDVTSLLDVSGYPTVTPAFATPTTSP